MRCIVFGHEWELGLCKVFENNQDLFIYLFIFSIVHRYPLYVQLLALISSSYQIQMGPPIWNFHHIHMNAHSTYLANFEFNEKWQGIKFSKNWKILWLLVTTPISHSMARNLHFSTKIQFSFTKRSNLKFLMAWPS